MNYKEMKNTRIAIVIFVVIVLAFNVGNVFAAGSYNLHGYVNDKMVGEIRQQYALELDNGIMVLNIDSGGGNHLSMNRILGTMAKAKQRGISTHCNVDTYAASAAAIILMNCDSATVSNYALISFHVIQVRGVAVASNSKTAEMRSLYDISLVILDSCCRRVMSKSEWEAIKLSEDVLIVGFVFNQRRGD